MRYVHIPLLLIVLFFGYVVFLLLKKDYQKLKAILYPGLFFIVAWLVFYYFLFE